MPTGIPGNAVTLAVGKQSAKGTAQTTPEYKLKLTGGDVAPARNLLTLAETDATRQAGAQVVTGSSVQGSTTHYLRPDDFALIAYGALGANADTGSTPNYTHTATSSSALPYFTLYKAYNSTSLVDQYIDCRISDLTVSGAAGGALTYAVTWQGLSAVLGSTDPVLTAVTQTPLAYPQVTVTKGGATPGTVDSFDLTVSNGGAMVQGDSGLSNIDFVPGLLAITGTISILFASDADYRAFHTGTTSGTAPTSVVYNEALTITAQVNANLSVAFVMAAVEYTAYPLAPDVSGAPLKVAMGFRAKPAASIANTLSIVVKNQLATAAP